MATGADLLRLLRERGATLSPLLILTHDHPDPDAMASALALRHVAAHYRMTSQIAYGGIIGRTENRAMVRELKIPIREVRPQDFTRYRHVALVDTQPRFGNNSLPRAHRPTIIIDHHPLDRRTRADLTVVEPTYGATATILTEILVVARMDIPHLLATALVYGIGSETQDLGRETGAPDIKAYLTLFPRCNTRLLAKIQHPPRSRDFFKTVGQAIQHAFLARRVIGAHLGPVTTPDLVSQLADFFVACEGIRWAICTGRYHERLFISLRTTSSGGRAGALLRRLVTARGGSAGGHGMIAGGSLVLGAAATAADWARMEHGVTTDLLRYLGATGRGGFEFPFRPDPFPGRHRGAPP